MKKRVTKDFETRSACDLKTAGAYKYSLHPTTQPTCLAFKIKERPTVYFLDFKMVNTPWRKLPQKLKNLWCALIADGYEFSAHNSFFERCIYDNILVDRYGWPNISPRRRRCTAAKAAACALPRNLEGAGEAMKLRVQKDKRGYVAMMATCKPTKQWRAWRKLQDQRLSWTAKQRERGNLPEPAMFIEPDTHPDIFKTLYDYCKIDVRAEELLDESLPDLIPEEQEIWHLNQRLNWRGLPIDIPTVRKIVSIMDTESKIKLKELDNLTMGLVTKPGARKSILDFLALEGIVLPDIKAQTVEDALKNGKITGDMKKLLELRKALSKTSTKKYQAFLNRSNEDDKVRDILMYHGASTGRDTGTGIQPHNFPRGLIKATKERPYGPVENVIKCDVDMLKLLYGDNLSILFSSILRNMIKPTEGKELFVADFSKIEVAVLWWLAGNKKGLRILLAGLDPYIYQASENTGKTYEEIEKAVLAEKPWALDARQLGKAQVLGCGFGMGYKKFKQTAWDIYRLLLKTKQSKEAVKSYRTINAPVPEVWEAYEVAAIKAVNSGKKVLAGKCEFECKDNFLWIKLPSGRRLAYRDPQINWRVREYEVETLVQDWEIEKDVDGKEFVRNEANELIDVEINDEGEKFYLDTALSAPKETLEFWAVNSKTKKWNLERTWGGTLTENIVQAVARDLMMPAMVRLEKAGYLSLLTVHDEGICEKEIGTGSVDEFVNILCERPKWAKGLPLEAKGWKGPRYRK